MNFFDSYSQKLAKNKIINSEDIDLYSYGMKQGLIMLLNLLTTLAIGLAFGMLVESIILTIAYIPIRIYSGGYHSKTQLTCYFVSIIIAVIELFIVKYIYINILISLFLSMLFGIVIFVLSPVEDENKPLDSTEIAVYKKKSRTILVSELAIFYLLIFFNVSKFANCILVSLGLMAIMLVVGKLKNCFLKDLAQEKENPFLPQ
ncbi:MAG: accessory gene regulator B family protein [Oscillospiraceae bacterium]